MKLNYKKSYRLNDFSQEKREELSATATRELTEFVISRMGNDLDAMLLFTLARDFGFRKHRLRKVYDGIFNAYKDLREAWQGNQREIIEDAKRELKGIGVDVELWNEQKREWLDGGYKDDECWNAFGQKGAVWKGHKK